MRDRREVLKLLAGGTAVAAGASLVTTSTAFADGGTERKRPTCPTSAATVAWSTATTDGRITITVSYASFTCPTSTWTAARNVALKVNNSLRIYAGNALIASSNNWSDYQPFTGTTLVFNVRKADGTNFNADVSGLTVDVMVRGSCTSGSRTAWCCSSFSRTDNYVYRPGANIDRWSTSATPTLGDFGGGTSNATCSDGTSP